MPTACGIWLDGAPTALGRCRFAPGRPKGKGRGRFDCRRSTQEGEPLRAHSGSPRAPPAGEAPRWDRLFHPPPNHLEPAPSQDPDSDREPHPGEEPTPRDRSLDPSPSTSTRDVDVLVVGSGIAGLTFALKAAD